MTSNGKTKELDTVILEMDVLERRIGETLKAMPRYGTHGHLRLAGEHTVADLARAIETYEAATR